MRSMSWLSALVLLLVPSLASAITLTGPQGYLWDIDDDEWGDVINGTSDAFDNWPQLCVTTNLSKTGNSRSLRRTTPPALARPRTRAARW